MLRYAASDLLDTAALILALPRPAPAVYERERLARRLTAQITHRGVRLDAAHIATLTELHRAAQAQAAGRMRAFAVDNPVPTSKSARPPPGSAPLYPQRRRAGHRWPPVCWSR